MRIVTGIEYAVGALLNPEVTPSFDETVTSIELNQFLKNLEKRDSSHLLSVCEKFGVRKNQLTPLSREGHFDGKFVTKVTKKNGNSQVFYPGPRAFPQHFLQIYLWLLEALSYEIPTIYDYMFTSEDFETRIFFEETEINDASKAAQYAGMLLATAQFTATTDLHHENVIFVQNVPIVIDHETVLQPVRAKQLFYLNKSRKQYPYSPFRSMLLNDIPSRKNASGLSKLLRVTKLDWHPAFLRSYSESFEFFEKNSHELINKIIHLTNDQCIFARYLVRTTSFYDSIKKWVGLMYSQDKEQVAFQNELSDLFRVEKEMFPEMSPTIEFDMDDLMTGDTPYWKLNLLSGELISHKKNRKISPFKEMPLKLFEKHINKVIYIGLENHVRAIRKILPSKF